MELDILTSNHQLEIQQILKDASSRISRFKEALESKQEQVDQEAKLKKLQKKHDLEKQQAQVDITAMKTKMSEREVKLSNEFQIKFDNLKREVENMNSRFQEKITQFESTNKSLKDALSAAANDTTALEALRKKNELVCLHTLRTLYTTILEKE